jgi:hypothetical protein
MLEYFAKLVYLEKLCGVVFDLMRKRAVYVTIVNGFCNNTVGGDCISVISAL